ncbi:MAG: glycosyltransferase, partial [Polynucleobacter sp.]|nr:glycosyltransferase [Polynucleobacter sp.]
MQAPQLSIVIPVYNEEEGLQALFDRLYPAMDQLQAKLNLRYEIVFVNDGSRDRSAGMLAGQYDLRPDVTRVVLFQNNFGQHMAIMAGFEYARGESIITLDADLQNPPEEIALLAAELIKGHDYVGTIRSNRQDSWFRKTASRAMNHLRQRITRITMTDQGCMLRGYSRRIVNLVRQCNESNTFIPALAYTFAANPTEIEVKHEERFAGESKYSLYQLIRLNFDLVTGFSVMPLQLFSIFGMLLAL